MAFIIDARSSIFDPLAFKNKLYIIRIVLLHLTEHIQYGACAVTGSYLKQYQIALFYHNQYPSTKECRHGRFARFI